MPRLIDADEAKEILKHLLYETAMNNLDIADIYEDIAEKRLETWLGLVPTVDAVPVVRCKDCKHKPSGSGANHDVEFPDEICPCQCEDYWYSWVPKDNFFCAWGERKEDDEIH